MVEEVDVDQDAETSRKEMNQTSTGRKISTKEFSNRKIMYFFFKEPEDKKKSLKSN